MKGEARPAPQGRLPPAWSPSAMYLSAGYAVCRSWYPEVVQGITYAYGWRATPGTPVILPLKDGLDSPGRDIRIPNRGVAGVHRGLNRARMPHGEIIFTPYLPADKAAAGYRPPAWSSGRTHVIPGNPAHEIHWSLEIPGHAAGERDRFRTDLRKPPENLEYVLRSAGVRQQGDSEQHRAPTTPAGRAEGRMRGEPFITLIVTMPAQLSHLFYDFRKFAVRTR